MSLYDTWSIDALRGYLVMSESFIKNSPDSSKEMYQRRINDIKNEIEKREKSDQTIERSLAYPEVNNSNT